MVEFNRQERTIRIKIAYYGPAVGGKTTNLKVTEAVHSDADTEMSAVYAILALNSGSVAAPESKGGVVHYVLQLAAAG